jgi:hypothetical protein
VRAPPPGPGRPVWFVYRVSWSPVDQKENCFGVGSLGGTKPGADLRLPAEAFIRLVYGRLDSAHTPPVETASTDLDELRRLFPGL